MNLDEAKSSICSYIDDISEELIAVSHAIHENPELGYEEHFAHEQLTKVLIDKGLDVHKSAYEIDTAFEATAGKAGPVVALLCEYDALPGIGHACGHNIIAAAGIGAGLAASTLAETFNGQLRILGTPAEEGGGGKVRMLNRGAFESVEAVLMIHPADADLPNISSLAVQQLKATYTGKAAHAAAAPEKGINALDGAVLGYMGVAALRQHIAPDERLHGIFTNGGQKANIVPERAESTWYARSSTMDRLEVLKIRLVETLNGGAKSAGCEIQIEWVNEPYAEVLDNTPILDAYMKNSELIGRVVKAPIGDGVVGSTDLGNVSHVVPSIHPMVKVAPEGTAIHTIDFEKCAKSEEADKGLLDSAKAMAMTVIDCWYDPSLLKQAKEFFRP
ncbi:MAG: M20 family metallopeptidase [Acidimicrobiales bacterium]|jgi:amidohydrolase|nr:M20 family metallopeptidase [Acidimicrobiales bacterium]